MLAHRRYIVSVHDSAIHDLSSGGRAVLVGQRVSWLLPDYVIYKSLPSSWISAQAEQATTNSSLCTRVYRLAVVEAELFNGKGANLLGRLIGLQRVVVHSRSAGCDGLQVAKILTAIPSIYRVELAGPWVNEECIEYLTSKRQIDVLVVTCPQQNAPLSANKKINGVQVYVELEGTRSYDLSYEFIDKCLDGRIK